MHQHIEWLVVEWQILRGKQHQKLSAYSRHGNVRYGILQADIALMYPPHQIAAQVKEQPVL
jgi:hypothetical protein